MIEPGGERRTQGSDVLVVGSGIAGLCAAAAAVEAGARVTILERASREDRGGNSRWTEAYLRMKSVEEVSDDFEESLIRNGTIAQDPAIVESLLRPSAQWPSYVRSHPMLDPEFTEAFSNQAGPTLQWLAKFGLRFDQLPIYHLAMSSPRMAAVGGGEALLQGLEAYLRSRGMADFRFRTTARRLIQNESGEVIGVEAVVEGEGRRKLYASSVVLASGGFEGNTEMLARYVGGKARYLRPVAPGGYFNRGEGIEMALAIGAAGAGEYSLYHAEPVDPRSRQAEAVVFVYTHGVLVNRDGNRFVDEVPDYPDVSYESICHRITEQPDGIAYAIFDESINDVPNWRRLVRSDQPPVSSDTLGGLASRIEIDAARLEHTISTYNGSCVAGRFSPHGLDGACTQGLTPRKSNWARPIQSPPYHAFPVMSAIVFTFGGIKTDSKARVISGDGHVIPGLFAAGEIAGIYHRNYTGATSVLRGAVFGRAAGECAAARSRLESSQMEVSP